MKPKIKTIEDITKRAHLPNFERDGTLEWTEYIYLEDYKQMQIENVKILRERLKLIDKALRENETCPVCEMTCWDCFCLEEIKAQIEILMTVAKLTEDDIK